MSPRRVAVLVGALLVVVAAAAGVVGHRLGADRSGVAWRTGEVQVSGATMTAWSDGRASGTSVGVGLWVDARGRQRDDGRPDCLPERGRVALRFAAVDVPVDGGSTSTLVAVDCRGARTLAP